MNQPHVWQTVLGEFEVIVSKASFNTWFRDTSVISNDNGHLVIAVPNIYTKDWLERKHHGDIVEKVSRLQPELSRVSYKVVPIATSAKTAREVKHRPVFHSQAQTALPVSSPARVKTSLNPSYTFSSYVVGASNELAHAACQAVAKNPGTKYSPLFLYGGVGLGKTHLIQATGNEVLRRNPDINVEYLTSEQFTSEFISSLGSKKNKRFADKYRGVDVLIIDDIQFLGNKEKTQEEFFHTFNTLHQNQKQVILSSDRAPKDIPNLEERLRSRFEWGMIADVQAPDLETRSAILHSKARIKGVELDDVTFEYIARHFEQNIRELEGALTQFLAFCEYHKLAPDVEAAKRVFTSSAHTIKRRKTINSRQVISLVARHLDIPPEDITGPKRDKEIAYARRLTMYLLRTDLHMSFPKVATCVGRKDHTTALHSVRKIEDLLENDTTIQADLSTLRQHLK